MDRRDALKKLGIGGATVAGASIVMSSPALANPGTPTCAATTGVPTITAVKTGNGTGQPVTITLTGLGTITCPCAGTATRVSGPSSWKLGGVDPTTTTATSATWSPANGTITLTFSIRVRCLDQGGKAVCSNYSVSASITVGGNSATISGLSAAGTYDPASCA